MGTKQSLIGLGFSRFLEMIKNLEVIIEQIYRGGGRSSLHKELNRWKEFVIGIKLMKVNKRQPQSDVHGVQHKMLEDGSLMTKIFKHVETKIRDISKTISIEARRIK
jgi:hypothetical protein